MISFDSLEDKYVVARYMYQIGEAIMTDSEYLAIHASMEKKGHPLTKQSWSADEPPIDLLVKYKLTHIIPKDKAPYTPQFNINESIGSITSLAELKRLESIPDSTLSLKLDGWNVTLMYHEGLLTSAHTRGRAGKGKTLENIYKTFPTTIPTKATTRVVGELIIEKQHKHLCTSNASLRDAVNSHSAKGDPENILSFYAFEIQEEGAQVSHLDKFKVLAEYGFKTPFALRVNSLSMIESMIPLLTQNEERGDYPTESDGLVLDTGFQKHALRLGAWENKQMIAKILRYKEERSINGFIPRLEVEQLDTGTIRNVPAYNYKTIIEQQWRIGTVIELELKSGTIVVPKIN